MQVAKAAESIVANTNQNLMLARVLKGISESGLVLRQDVKFDILSKHLF